VKQPRSVQVVLYRDGDGRREYLLLRRCAPGLEPFWQPVSGSLEEGEPPEAAALREVREETGIGALAELRDIRLVSRFRIAAPWLPRYAHGTTHNVQYSFAARASTATVTLDRREHDEYRWVGRDEALALLRHAPNRRAVELVDSGQDQARRRRYQWRAGAHTLTLGERSLVMGVLNVTPDSFFDGGAYTDHDQAIRRGLQMEEEGADLIDVGGESSRPGAVPVGATEEIRRIAPVIEALAGRLRVPISIDTTRSETARVALAAGAAIVNDISALRLDPSLAEVAAEAGAGLVLMHMRGEPRTMHKLPPAADILMDVEACLLEAIGSARERGVDHEAIVLDPGIGFGKTVAQNVELLASLGRLAALDRPLLVGTSRKSFLGGLTGRGPAERRDATVASLAVAVLCGAHIVRVHDVDAARDAVRVADAVLGALG
jgi:dihydropteroate synthase